MDPLYLRPGVDFALAHTVEECAEVGEALALFLSISRTLAAIGKTQRFGLASVNPELPPAQRETNEAWLRREMADLRGALDRMEAALDRPDAASLSLLSAELLEEMRVTPMTIGQIIERLGLLEASDVRLSVRRELIAEGFTVAHVRVAGQRETMRLWFPPEPPAPAEPGPRFTLGRHEQGYEVRT